MQVRAIRIEEYEQARLLLQKNGWGPRVADAAQFAALLEHSQVVLVAVVAGKVVGFLRAITDGMFNGYISMMVVAEEHRGKDIGTRLVREAMGESPKMTWVLRRVGPAYRPSTRSWAFALRRSPWSVLE